MDMNAYFEDKTAQLRQAGTPYAVATVVRTINATSAKPGAKAIVMQDGSISEGWVGGGCIRSAIGKAAKTALKEARPQFISLRPQDVLSSEGLEAGDVVDGVKFARNGCPSQGSMDIFIEPVIPQPELIICGQGPVALALAELARTFNFDTTLCAPALATDETPENINILNSFEFSDQTSTNRFIVVATQGKNDENALKAVLETRADYIGFVGSKLKFATLADRLCKSGMDERQFANVKCPAGLNIGAITPEEIALSILSEITMKRRDAQRGDGVLQHAASP